MIKKILISFLISFVVCFIFAVAVFLTLGPITIWIFTGCAWWLLGYIFTLPAFLTICVIIGANKLNKRR